MSDKIIAMIKEKDVEFVDLRFTDPSGMMQHLTLDTSMIDDAFFADGTMFDGSSIGGWKAINESDMVLMPDPQTVRIDPFCQQTTLTLFCDILNPGVLTRYNRDPRGSARAAEKYLKSSGLGDVAYFGPEPEFFIFDDVRWTTHPHASGYRFDSTELPANSGRRYQGGNMGHRPAPKGGYFPVPPIDSGQDIRSEMLEVMSELGLEPEKHHHEVAPAQHELGIRFAPLVEMGDRMQLFKHIVHNVAASYGKSASFMPKPYLGDNGSGMHVHQSIWKNDKPSFAGDQYADLSQECLYYIGGIIKHAKAINAFSNASTNSYKRLVPGFEAPVLLAYSSRNRSASVRIPHVASASAKRIEVRFPDSAGNPYLTFTALLMAGLDGIENRIDPKEPMDKDLYSLPPEELKNVPSVCTSLREALGALDADRFFLTRGGVMDDDQIDAYIAMKMDEVIRVESHPHPVEFDMYYKC